jgi:hypothetical protein
VVEVEESRIPHVRALVGLEDPSLRQGEVRSGFESAEILPMSRDTCP